jgi:hypothetical protein
MLQLRMLLAAGLATAAAARAASVAVDFGAPKQPIHVRHSPTLPSCLLRLRSARRRFRDRLIESIGPRARSLVQRRLPGWRPRKSLTVNRPLAAAQGFGTSLCWWAIGVGGWSNDTAFELYMDHFFGPTGLGLNQVCP